MKLRTHLGVKLSEDDKASISEAARSQGLNLSEYVRRAALGSRPQPAGERPAPSTAPTTLAIYHVDDLGPDPLRADNGALAR